MSTPWECSQGGIRIDPRPRKRKILDAKTETKTIIAVIVTMTSLGLRETGEQSVVAPKLWKI